MQIDNERSRPDVEPLLPQLGKCLTLPFLASAAGAVRITAGMPVAFYPTFGITFSSALALDVHAPMAGCAVRAHDGILMRSFATGLLVHLAGLVDVPERIRRAVAAPSSDGCPIPRWPYSPGSVIPGSIAWLRAGESCGRLSDGGALRMSVYVQEDSSGERRFLDPFGHNAAADAYALDRQDPERGLWLDGDPGLRWSVEPAPFPELPPLAMPPKPSLPRCPSCRALIVT